MDIISPPVNHRIIYNEYSLDLTYKIRSHFLLKHLSLGEINEIYEARNHFLGKDSAKVDIQHLTGLLCNICVISLLMPNHASSKEVFYSKSLQRNGFFPNL